MHRMQYSSGTRRFCSTYKCFAPRAFMHKLAVLPQPVQVHMAPCRLLPASSITVRNAAQQLNSNAACVHMFQFMHSVKCCGIDLV
jgi:hypothetical protein